MLRHVEFQQISLLPLKFSDRFLSVVNLRFLHICLCNMGRLYRVLFSDIFTLGKNRHPTTHSRCHNHWNASFLLVCNCPQHRCSYLTLCVGRGWWQTYLILFQRIHLLENLFSRSFDLLNHFKSIGMRICFTRNRKLSPKLARLR